MIIAIKMQKKACRFVILQAYIINSKLNYVIIAFHLELFISYHFPYT